MYATACCPYGVHLCTAVLAEQSPCVADAVASLHSDKTFVVRLVITDEPLPV